MAVRKPLVARLSLRRSHPAAGPPAVIGLSVRDSLRVLRLLQRPARPTPALLAAARRLLRNRVEPPPQPSFRSHSVGRRFRAAVWIDAPRHEVRLEEPLKSMLPLDTITAVAQEAA